MTKDAIEDLEHKENVSEEESIDPYGGFEQEHEESSEKMGQLFENLKRVLKYNNNEWASIAFDLIIGKLIMDYKYLIYVENESKIKGGKQSHDLVYKIGSLINDFIERRKIDAEKPELRGTSRADFNETSVINLLSTIIAEKSSRNDKDIPFKNTYLRNFTKIVQRFSIDEFKPDIPVYIYKELVERIPRDMFPHEATRKSFQNKILQLRREMEFTDRHLRLAISIIREDVPNRNSIDYLRKVMPIIKTVPTKLSFEQALIKVKEALKDN